MAAVNRNDIQRRLKKLNERFSLIEECLDLDGHFTLLRSIRNLKRRQQILKRQFYDLLAPFYEGNIASLYFHELPYLVFPLVVGSGPGKEAALVVLAQRIEVFEKLTDERLEVIDDWITDVVVSRGTGIAIKENDDIQGKLFLLFDRKKGKLSFLAELVDDLREKVRDEKRPKAGESQETDRVLSLKDIALEFYGLHINIATDIEKSLPNRKQLLEDEDEIQFLEDEVEMVLYDYGGYTEWQEDDAGLSSWDTVKNLKIKFKELKEDFLYKTEGVDDQNAEPKASSSKPDNEDPYLTQLKIERFPKVTRYWIFHIESVLFHLLYEIIEKMSESEASEIILQGFLAKLKKLTEINNGMVPITVYKVVALMDDPLSLMAPRAEGSDTGKLRLHEKIMLSDVMDLIHGIMLRLGPVLQVNASLTEIGLIRQVELVWLEHTLEQIEQEMREIERYIKGTNSGSEEKADTEKLNE